MKKRYCILISVIAIGLVVIGIVFRGNKRMSVTECPLKEETIISAMKECDFPEDIYVEYNEDGVPEGYPATAYTLRREDKEVYAGHCMGILSTQYNDARNLGLTINTIDREREVSEEELEQAVVFATQLFGGFRNEKRVYKALKKEINLQENFEWTKKIDGFVCNVKYKAGDEEIAYILNVGFSTDLTSLETQKSDKDSTLLDKRKDSAQVLAGEFLNNLFSSDAERYSNYKRDSGDQFNPTHRDTNFLEESYVTEYMQLYEEQCTDNCLNNMEYYSLFTYVDYLADAGDGIVTMKDVELNETNEYQQQEESAQKRNRREYYYTVTLNLNSQGQSKEFKVQGAISLVKSGDLWKNQWKVADVMLSDYEALSIYITGKNVTESL